MFKEGSQWCTDCKERKKERLQERFEKLVEGLRERHDKMVDKGCTFEKINQSASAGVHFLNHGKMCESMSANIKDLTYWGQDFIADCSSAPKGLIERNHAWWKKYSDKIQKYKLKMEKHAQCYEETKCGCYAKDEEIPIAKDQCVLNLGTFPDVDGWWKFTFELKINSLPNEGEIDWSSNWSSDSPVEWSLDFLSIAMDGYNSHDGPQFPMHLMYFTYNNLSRAGLSLQVGNINRALLQPLSFVEGQWYKFTVTGKPIGSDGEIMWFDWRNPGQKPAKCRNEYSIEGPGMREVGGKFSYTFETPCLEMQEGYPLKVFAAKEVISQSMDGVVRNIVFENTATDTSINTTC